MTNQKTEQIFSLNNAIFKSLVSNRKCGYTRTLDTIAEDGKTIIIKGSDNECLRMPKCVSLYNIGDMIDTQGRPTKIMFDSDALIELCALNNQIITDLMNKLNEANAVIEQLSIKK